MPHLDEWAATEGVKPGKFDQDVMSQDADRLGTKSPLHERVATLSLANCLAEDAHVHTAREEIDIESTTALIDAWLEHLPATEPYAAARARLSEARSDKASYLFGLLLERKRMRPPHSALVLMDQAEFEAYCGEIEDMDTDIAPFLEISRDLSCPLLLPIFEHCVPGELMTEWMDTSGFGLGGPGHRQLRETLFPQRAEAAQEVWERIKCELRLDWLPAAFEVSPCAVRTSTPNVLILEAGDVWELRRPDRGVWKDRAAVKRDSWPVWNTRVKSLAAEVDASPTQRSTLRRRRNRLWTS